jgi:hypothetical protein
MSCPITNIFGLRTGGVLSGPIDVKDVKERIIKIIEEMSNQIGQMPDLGEGGKLLDQCMSKELSGGKGSYIVIAGVFNYWYYESSSQFAKRLSEEFSTEVIHVCWEEGSEKFDCMMWCNGKEFADSNESQIHKVLRRTF